MLPRRAMPSKCVERARLFLVCFSPGLPVLSHHQQTQKKVSGCHKHELIVTAATHEDGREQQQQQQQQVSKTTTSLTTWSLRKAPAAGQ
ncbi:hypothetical protein M441DRAFT_314807 [Trichoderma asperellum CBS 433.97]|uniref:Uncharacterized protein n=1 Tax=Trichoderma asperellum (strain ATCC 204424 / CBS 433.97 / NBRC 101777) TaxID=1042311 RepID=A0A2T3ZKJ5_TRIA4|nr:hypothetical protein M441DRAFT_314807 [Trichoderma asperellum CBS 433.97]PTB45325.1 hypothetical protein M441DRAFT_314807 [Trichoderma asperellum CBS 433.97]